MIERFTDHTANERTYLAWLRTAISIMAFGFVVEKFELFLGHLGGAVAGVHVEASKPAEILGLGLFIVAIVIIIGSTIRYFAYRRAIDVRDSMPYGGRRSNIVLSFLLTFFALFLVLYMWHQFL